MSFQIADTFSNQIDPATHINDTRTPAEFRGNSFSLYKKPNVKTALCQNMYKGKIEPACYWCAELLCCGLYSDIWDVLLFYAAKYVHFANPKIMCYLEKRYEDLEVLLHSGTAISELHYRNDAKVRRLFAEVVAVLSVSPKRPSMEPIKINRQEEFDMTLMTERFRADSVEYAQALFQSEDPKEVFIPMNEFLYCLRPESADPLAACYWVIWMLDFEQLCKKRKDRVFCQRRPFTSSHDVHPKASRDLVWLIWDGLLQSVNTKYGTPQHLAVRTMQSLLRMFCVHYTNAACKKRQYMLYFAVNLCIEPWTPYMNSIPLISDKSLVEIAMRNIDTIYKQIKANEVAPRTDYLFHGLNQARLEQSLERMNAVLGYGMDSAGDFNMDEMEREYDDS